MRKLELYQCEVCGIQYKDEKDCKACEDSHVKAIRITGAIMALGAVMLDAKRQEICEYCHEDSGGYVKPIEKNNHAFVRFGMNGWELDLKANGWHGSAKIRYCPMCGRDLLVK